MWPPYAVQVTASGSGQAGLGLVPHTGQDGRSLPASSGLGVLPGVQPWFAEMVARPGAGVVVARRSGKGLPWGCWLAPAQPWSKR